MPQTNTKFRNRRLGRSWTLPELAALCVAAGAPTDDGNLSRIERGLQVPRPKLRGVLADLLGLELTDFDLPVATEAAPTSERASA
jgi:transcriptional regulator with XRE-family HTH domain